MCDAERQGGRRSGRAAPEGHVASPAVGLLEALGEPGPGKRVSEDFVDLLAVDHNMKPFGRGSVHEARTPARLAGIPRPTES